MSSGARGEGLGGDQQQSGRGERLQMPSALSGPGASGASSQYASAYGESAFYDASKSGYDSQYAGVVGGSSSQYAEDDNDALILQQLSGWSAKGGQVGDQLDSGIRGEKAPVGASS